MPTLLISASRSRKLLQTAASCPSCSGVGPEGYQNWCQESLIGVRSQEGGGGGGIDANITAGRQRLLHNQLAPLTHVPEDVGRPLILRYCWWQNVQVHGQEPPEETVVVSL